jgi:hypothetical protein
VDTVEKLLDLGARFTVSVAKTARDIVLEVNELFKRHGLEITANSEPTAVDYVINMCLGGMIGAVGGAAVGGGLLATARAASIVLPGPGWAYFVGSVVVGSALGAATGAALTIVGLRIRFSPGWKEGWPDHGIPKAAGHWVPPGGTTAG